MKKSIVVVVMATSLLSSSCLGSFQAFNNLKDWNQGVSQSKWVNNLLFWGLVIIPVYPVFLIGDAIIFNVIEFWSGSNPIAMEDGEREVQVVEFEGNLIQMVATRNRMQLSVLEGPRKGETLEMFYNPDEKSWNAVRPDGEILKLSSMEEGFYVVHLPDGKEIQLSTEISREEGMALVQEHTACYTMEGMLAQGDNIYQSK